MTLIVIHHTLDSCQERNAILVKINLRKRLEKFWYANLP